MPLRDHFRPPLTDRRSWEGVHGGWPMMIVQGLNRDLPEHYVAEPQVHLGPSVEVDVAAYDENPLPGREAEQGPAEAAPTALWAPSEPTLAVATAPPDLDEYEVRVYNTRSGRRLVAAVEIVSPANKDRPEHRRAFIIKCAALLQERVCVAIVDIVTTRSPNLYRDLLEQLGQTDDIPPIGGPPPLYAAACRRVLRAGTWFLESWAYPLTLGQSLPTLPLWLADDLAVPLDLERSYEQTCRVLRIP